MITHRCECGNHIFAFTSTQAGVILVSPEDESLLRERTWTAAKRRYTFNAQAGKRYGKRLKIIRLHQLIAGKYPDHKNRNGLDNRRENLRSVTRGQNGQNRPAAKSKIHSKWLGVHFYKDGRKFPWTARIHFEGRSHYLGSFTTENDETRIPNLHPSPWSHIPACISVCMSDTECQPHRGQANRLRLSRLRSSRLSTSLRMQASIRRSMICSLGFAVYPYPIGRLAISRSLSMARLIMLLRGLGSGAFNAFPTLSLASAMRSTVCLIPRRSSV